MASRLSVQPDHGMTMTASIIGALLDEALEFATTAMPKPVVADLTRYGITGVPEPQMVQPRSVARALLANRLRDMLARLFEQDAVWDDGSPCPPYRQLAAIGHRQKDVQYDRLFEADATPDALVRASKGEPIIAVEVCYGFEEDVVRAAMDRLLKLVWLQATDAGAAKSLRLVACVFMHETDFGETIRETERTFDDWIGETWGPFAGMDRTGMPMMPRITRTAMQPAFNGAFVSAIDLKTRPTGYAAFCISYDYGRS